MRGIVERLAPLATIYCVGVSYDPFVSKRLSMLYRIARLDDGQAPRLTRMTRLVAAIRPVTTSQLLGACLDGRTLAFTLDAAVTAVESALAGLPNGSFVDPELRRDPRAMVRRALPLMAQWGILERDGDRYRLSAQRRHPQFPFVEDIIAYQKRFLEETIEHAAHAGSPERERVRIRRDNVASTADRRL
jgi:hypothetical protein